LSARLLFSLAFIASFMVPPAHSDSARLAREAGFNEGCLADDGPILSRSGVSNAVIRKFCACSAKLFAANISMDDVNLGLVHYEAKTRQVQALIASRCAPIVRANTPKN
jgi:hypothetical protein